MQEDICFNWPPDLGAGRSKDLWGFSTSHHSMENKRSRAEWSSAETVMAQRQKKRQTRLMTILLTNSSLIITYLLTYLPFFMLKVKNNSHRKGKLNNTLVSVSILLSFSKGLTDVASKPTAKHLNSHTLFHRYVLMHTFWNCSPSFWDTQIERSINPPVSKDKKDRPRSARVWCSFCLSGVICSTPAQCAHLLASFGIAQTWNKYTRLNCYSGFKFDRKIYMGYQDSYAWPVVLVIMNHFNPFPNPNPSLGLINIWCSKLVRTDVWKGVEHISWQLPDLSSKRRNLPIWSLQANSSSSAMNTPWTNKNTIRFRLRSDFEYKFHVFNTQTMYNNSQI